MKLYKNVATLLLVATAVATDTVGDTWRIDTSSEDQVEDEDQDYQLYVFAQQSGGASSPTSQVKIQTSPNGEDWVDLADSTALSTATTKVETLTDATGPILKYIRAITVLGGGTNPDHRCDVRIVSTAPFRLRKIG